MLALTRLLLTVTLWSSVKLQFKFFFLCWLKFKSIVRHKTEPMQTSLSTQTPFLGDCWYSSTVYLADKSPDMM